MAADETIAAIATAPGTGAVGIVRVSGPHVREIASRLVGGVPAPRYASYRTVTGVNGDIIDDAVVIYFEGPASFTGEDVLEIQTHGGMIVTGECLAAVIRAGARAAAPGEFTERAFLNGKLDLLQAEAVADLIGSTSTRAARLARASLVGEFSRQVTEINDALRQIRVQLEAAIDFPDESIPTATLDALVNRTQEIRSDIDHLLETATRGARLNAGIDIAIVGRPNAGKSTLLNRLAGNDRAIVDAAPGTTRDVLSIDVELCGLAVRLHDTAGIRETEDPVEQEGVRRAKRVIDAADAVLHVHTGDDEDDPDFHGHTGLPLFSVRNKIDLTGESAALLRKRTGAAISLSAKTGVGIDLLIDAILAEFDLEGDADNTILARERHISSLAAARDALGFDAARLYREAPELAAEQLRLAGIELGRLTGEFTTEDLLGEIFSTFCLGK